MQAGGQYLSATQGRKGDYMAPEYEEDTNDDEEDDADDEDAWNDYDDDPNGDEYYADDEDDIENDESTTYVTRRDWSETMRNIGCAFLLLLWVWGGGWTYYRYGSNSAYYAFTIPPYAWYRGVAVLWDPPKWKDDWDERTEAIGRLVNLADDDEAMLSAGRFRQTVREWIASLPQEERDRLREHVESFGDARIQYINNIAEDTPTAMAKDMPTTSDLRPITHPSVEAFVKKFAANKGLLRAWNLVRAEEETYPATFVKTVAAGLPKERRELVVFQIATRMVADQSIGQIRATIADLFETSSDPD
jgi:hypothetical protein